MTIFPQPEQELIAGYVLGNLSPEEQQLFNQLLQAKPALDTEVERLQATLGLLPYALPDTEPGPTPALRARILQAAQATAPPVRQFPWTQALIGLAAVGVVVLGLDNYQLRQGLTTTQAQLAQERDVLAMLQQPQTQLVTMKGMAEGAQASGSILITPGTSEAVLLLQNLPPLTEGQVYRLWRVFANQPEARGDFTPGPQGTVFIKLPAAATLPGGVLAVTIEPTQILPKPTGPMVMTSGA
ncbi:anti-sigma factor domain-containing protein [Candidatus Cyanaurora vandensis]|uniref:anti-sigma factor n=1 Tax=Candidatus Cyanaurora vandensis TaxID=2714958 RepID=UPI00257C0CCB|nr:anti-sigma factor [Candidatus Cyanaurora vandensis]